jgi:hypothetical protein
LIAQDQLLEDQEDLLEQEIKNTCKFKKLLKLEKEKNVELAQGNETTSSLKSLSDVLQDSYDVLKKTHKDLEVQFDDLWASILKPLSTLKTSKASTSNGCERCYNINIDALCAQSQHSNIKQVLVESCDEDIGKDNDNLKLEVKRLEQKVNMLEKQANVQPFQDNYRNMVNKLEKERTMPKLASQQGKKPSHHKKEENANIDKKIKFVRSVFLNARSPHIKNGIGYKSGDKNNSRVNSNGKEFIKFIKGNSYQEKKRNLNNTNHVSYANASYVSPMSYHEFDASYVLMRNKFSKIIALYIGPHHKRSKTCVWMSKYLVTNLKGPKQIWTSKSKA